MRTAALQKFLVLLGSLAAALVAATGAGASPAVAIADSHVAIFSPPGYIGGDFQTTAGETVHVFSSPAYLADTTYDQRWVDFLSTMPHGA